jgi:hypothetical protein
MFKFIPEEYLFFKGGGNGMMMYMMMQQQQQAEQAKREEQARNDAAAEQSRQVAAQAEQKRVADIQASQQRVGGAYNSALDYGKNKLRAKGVDPDSDPYGVMNLYRSSLDRARAGAPEMVADPNSLFSTTLLDDAMNEARGTQRSNYGRQVKSTFGDDYGRSQFGDTMDDAILQSILDTQKGEANTNLDRALARGTINEIGRSSAGREVDNMTKMGLAKANTLGDTVLGGYRTQLDEAVGKSRGHATDWDFGDTFDIGKEKGGIESLKGSLSGRLEGDILNALSGQKFYDPDILLGKAGAASGITNVSGLGGTSTGGQQPFGQTTLSQTSGVTDRTKAPAGERTTNSLDEVL